MKMLEKTGKVTTSGNLAPSQFRIKASRKAFEILSAGLYSDKVRAIIRELSTNAADSHTMAGRGDVPFEVHLPNSWEPWFSVTDHGVGLSDDQIHSVYTTYFESDKTDSNDVTGCLGLGSKSPFSYTDTFSIESVYNGVKTLYNAYLNEEGMPAIAKMTEEPTEEANGVTVKFPVKSGDFNDFEGKAMDTLKWFKVRPTVTGARNFHYPEPMEYLRKTDNYAVYQTKQYNYYNRATSFVVMGNVAYPIEAGEFLNNYSGDDSSKLRALVEWGIELYVNVGDCDISASREKLGYDKRTIRHLKDALRAALADLETEVTKDIASKPNLWEAREALHKVRTSFQGFDFKAIWNGEAINDFVKVAVREVEIPDEKNPGKTRKVQRAVADVEAMKVKSYSGNRVVVKKDRADTIHADGTTIFLNDERGAYAAVRRYLSDKSYGHRVLLISDYTQEWLDETGIGSVAIKTSTLPKPERVKGERGSSVRAKLYEYVPDGNATNGSSSAGGYWQPAEVEVDDGGVYVEILYFNYRMSDKQEKTQHPSDLNRPLKLLKALGKPVTLYGIRPSDKAMLDKSEGEWQNLHDYASEVVKEVEVTYHDDFIKAQELQQAVGGYYRKKVPFEEFAKTKFQPDSLFGAFVAQALDAKRAMENASVKAYGELRAWLSLAGIKDEDVQGMVKAQEALFIRYPLLQYIDPYRTGDDYNKHAAEYINLIDNQDDSQQAAA